MTDPNYTHMAFLLDASGSMATIKSDIEGGFDAFIAEQRTQPGLDRARGPSTSAAPTTRQRRPGATRLIRVPGCNSAPTANRSST